VKSFSAKIEKIGINPYVTPSREVLEYLFKTTGKQKGQFPVITVINKQKFDQTIVKYKGQWRLYLNTPIRRVASKDVGDIIVIRIDHDPKDRTVPLHPKFESALAKNEKALETFERLSPSRKKEIARYLNHLKNEDTLLRNIKRAIGFLQGENRFVGRDRP